MFSSSKSLKDSTYSGEEYVTGVPNSGAAMTGVASTSVVNADQGERGLDAQVNTLHRSPADLAGLIQQVLQGASRREALEALTMVASVRGYRVVSMDRPINPIGVQSQTPGPSSGPKGKKPKGASRAPKASWRVTPAALALASQIEALELVSKKEGPKMDPKLQTDLRDLRKKYKALRPPGSGD